MSASISRVGTLCNLTSRCANVVDHAKTRRGYVGIHTVLHSVCSVCSLLSREQRYLWTNDAAVSVIFMSWMYTEKRGSEIIQERSFARVGRWAALRVIHILPWADMEEGGKRGFLSTLLQPGRSDAKLHFEVTRGRWIVRPTRPASFALRNDLHPRRPGHLYKPERGRPAEKALGAQPIVSRGVSPKVTPGRQTLIGHGWSRHVLEAEQRPSLMHGRRFRLGLVD